MMGLPNCREAALLLSEEHDRPEGQPRTFSVRLHLLMCSACRRYARQLEWLQRTLHRFESPQGPAALPSATRERILERLRQIDSGQG